MFSYFSFRNCFFFPILLFCALSPNDFFPPVFSAIKHVAVMLTVSARAMAAIKKNPEIIINLFFNRLFICDCVFKYLAQLDPSALFPLL